jgi:hypothetical protein
MIKTLSFHHTDGKIEPGYLGVPARAAGGDRR